MPVAYAQANNKKSVQLRPVPAIHSPSRPGSKALEAEARIRSDDAIAMKLGIDKSAMVRVRAGISYALTEAMDEGHCGLPTDDLVPLAEKLLEVPQELVRTALDRELADDAVIADTVGDKPCVFLAGLYRAERGIAERLLQLGTGKLPWPWIDPDKAIPCIEQRTGLVFAESQRSAVALALASAPFSSPRMFFSRFGACSLWPPCYTA